MIKNIIFDFGGVLVDWDPRYLYRKLSADHEKVEHFVRNICNLDWNHQLDAGVPFSIAISEQKSRYPEHSEWIELYQTHWHEMIRSEIHGTVDILTTLAIKKIPLYGLTNWSSETFPLALKRFSFFQYFDGIVVSGTEKLIKPDPRIFLLILTRYSLNPSETLFIDDVEKNILAAQNVGLVTHHFKTPELLKEYLTLEKIL